MIVEAGYPSEVIVMSAVAVEVPFHHGGTIPAADVALLKAGPFVPKTIETLPVIVPVPRSPVPVLIGHAVLVKPVGVTPVTVLIAEDTDMLLGGCAGGPVLLQTYVRMPSVSMLRNEAAV